METTNLFRVQMPADVSFLDNFDVVQTMFPDLKDRVALTKKAFEVAARALIAKQLEVIAEREASDNETDRDAVMALQFHE